jgi:hypothetical protein
MILNTLPKNLLFSLPDALISEIYLFDSTYRLFENYQFEEDITEAYLKRNDVRQKCIQEITTFIENSNADGSEFYNDYGYFDAWNDQLNQLDETKDKVKYESVNDFFVSLHQIEEVLYFKILPKGATKKNCAFLRKPKRFDGYFLHERSDGYLAEQRCNYSGEAVENVDNNVHTSIKMYIDIYTVI